MLIECAFSGFLAADAELRTSEAGNRWVRLRVGVGKDETVQWVSVAAFGKAAETAAELKKGDRVYIEGSLRLTNWRGKDGAERFGLSVAANRCEQTHTIGHNKPRKERQPRPDRIDAIKASAANAVPFNDEIGF